MSRTIKQLFPGTSVWLEYNGNLEEWLVTEDTNSTRVVILRKFLLPTARRMHSSNVSVYNGCEMDLWLENETTGYLAGFDAATLACLTSTSIQTYTYGDTEPTIISRRSFIPSQDNLFGNDSIETEISWLTALMRAYNTTSGDTARIGRLETNNLACSYFLRSPGSASQFRLVKGDGTSYVSNASSNSNYVRPALSVSADTLVSDEGADIIKLLPDPSKTYREVSFTGYLGSMQMLPKKTRVIANAVNLYDVDVQVTNNAKDAEPVWVDATGGEEITFMNTTKTSEDYEIGVKCYGKSDGIGYFNEPTVLILE